MSVCLYVSVRLPISRVQPVTLTWVCLCLCVSLYVCMSVCMCVCLYLSMSVCVSVRLPISRVQPVTLTWVYLCLYVSLYVSICLSVSVSVRLPISRVQPVTLTWVFQRSRDNVDVNDNLSSADFARIYLINVTNTLQGGAALCRQCPRGIQHDRSVGRSVGQSVPMFSLFIVIVSM